MYILLRLTDKNQQCCFVCLLVSRWKAQLVRRCPVFWATGTLTKQICICLQQSCFIAGNEIGINMRRFRPVSAQGCSFITLLSWLTTKFSHQNLFRHVLMRNWGSVCHSWFDFSVSVAHLRCCVRSAGRRGEFFFWKKFQSVIAVILLWLWRNACVGVK